MADSSWREFIDVISTVDTAPDSCAASFTNVLPQAQHFPSDADVYAALVEFEYTHCFHNVQTETLFPIVIFDMKHKWKPEPGVKGARNPNTYPTYGKFHFLPLPSGYYDTAEKICDVVNQTIKNSGIEDLKDRDIFTYNPLTLKVSYDLSDLWITLLLRGEILVFLGMDRGHDGLEDFGMWGKSKVSDHYLFPVPPTEEGKGEGTKEGEGESSKEQGEGEKKQMMSNDKNEGEEKEGGTGEGEGDKDKEGEGDKGKEGEGDKDKDKEQKYEKRMWDQPKNQWTINSPPKGPAAYATQLTLIHSFFIYVNVIESQIIANTFSDVLRIVAIKEHQSGSRVIVEFLEPFYLKVNKRHIPELSVKILDQYGRKVNFLVDDVRLKLRFITKSS